MATAQSLADILPATCFVFLIPAILRSLGICGNHPIQTEFQSTGQFTFFAQHLNVTNRYAPFFSYLLYGHHFHLYHLVNIFCIEILNNLKLTGNILLVVEELTENVILATRNIPNVILLEANEINTYDVISADVMVITEGAVKMLEEVLV